MSSGSFDFGVTSLVNVSSSGFHQAYYRKSDTDVEIWARFNITPILPNSKVQFKFTVPLSIDSSKPVFGEWSAMGTPPCLWHLNGFVQYGGSSYLLCTSQTGALQTNALPGEVQVYAKYSTT